MREWVLLLGAATLTLVAAAASAIDGGTIPAALCCLAGGRLIAGRDHLYQQGRASR